MLSKTTRKSNVRSTFNWFTGLCNSQCKTHFAVARTNDTRTTHTRHAKTTPHTDTHNQKHTQSYRQTETKLDQIRNHKKKSKKKKNWSCFSFFSVWLGREPNTFRYLNFSGKKSNISPRTPKHSYVKRSLPRSHHQEIKVRYGQVRVKSEQKPEIVNLIGESATQAISLENESNYVPKGHTARCRRRLACSHQRCRWGRRRERERQTERKRHQMQRKHVCT